MCKGLEDNDPANPTVEQVPCIETNLDSISDPVVSNHTDKKWDHIDSCHDTSTTTELCYQRCLRGFPKLPLWSNRAVPWEVEGTIEDIGKDIEKDEDKVKTGRKRPKMNFDNRDVENPWVVMTELMERRKDEMTTQPRKLF